MQDEIVFKGQRCIIPMNLLKTIKQKLHRSHGGIQSCLRRTREVVYWSGMTKELTDYIQQCETCNTYSSEQQRQPLIPHEIPEWPWQRVACDIFTLQGKDYLCMHGRLLLGILRSRQAREKRCQTDHKKAKTPLRQSWDTFGIGQWQWTTLQFPRVRQLRKRVWVRVAEKLTYLPTKQWPRGKSFTILFNYVANVWIKEIIIITDLIP